MRQTVFVRKLRTHFRLLRTVLHLCQGSATVAFIYPWLGEQRRQALKQRWSRQLLAMLGVQLRYRGGLPTANVLPGGLIVANHISFLDIFVVNAVAPTAFVSKDDVRNWPLIGWLCARTDTVFLERGSRIAAQRTRERLVSHLSNGKRIALFPEGTTTRGDTVLPFRSALLQSAIDANTPVTPVVLRYRSQDGSPSIAPAYVDDISLFECLLSIATETRIYAEIVVHPPLANTIDRRELSAHAHRVILRTLNRDESHESLADLNQPMATSVAG